MTLQALSPTTPTVPQTADLTDRLVDDLSRSSAVLNIASTALMFIPGAAETAGVIKLVSALSWATFGVSLIDTGVEAGRLANNKPDASFKTLLSAATGLLPGGSLMALDEHVLSGAAQLWNTVCVGIVAVNTAIAAWQGARIVNLIHKHEATGDDWLYLASAIAGVAGTAKYVSDDVQMRGAQQNDDGTPVASKQLGAGGGTEGPAAVHSRIGRVQSHPALRARMNNVLATGSLAAPTNQAQTDDQRRQQTAASLPVPNRIS